MEEAKHDNEERQPEKYKAVVPTDEEEEEIHQHDDNHTVSSSGSSPLHTISSSPTSSSTHPPAPDSRFRSTPHLPSKSPEPQPREDSDSPPHAVDSPSNSSLTSDHSTISRVSTPRVEPELLGPDGSPSPGQNGLINALAITPVAVSTAEAPAEDGFVERPHFERGGLGATGGGGGGRRLRPDLSILKRARRESMVKKALLAFRVCGLVFCLVAFSVMAADRNQGWALDSFYRYKELRFCLVVNAIGFIYSGLQAFDLAYFSATGKHIVRHRLRPQVDFFLDQIISYLLISAISSAATRVEDWQLNWGKDKFPEMATASVAITILSFVAFALCSVISGYTLCTHRSL